MINQENKEKVEKLLKELDHQTLRSSRNLLSIVESALRVANSLPYEQSDRSLYLIIDGLMTCEEILKINPGWASLTRPRSKTIGEFNSVLSKAHYAMSSLILYLENEQVKT